MSPQKRQGVGAASEGSGSPATESQPSGKVRIQFDFSRDSLARLDEIVEGTFAASRAEVIRRALTLYSEVVRASRRDAQLQIVEPDGGLTRLLPLI